LGNTIVGKWDYLWWNRTLISVWGYKLYHLFHLVSGLFLPLHFYFTAVYFFTLNFLQYHTCYYRLQTEVVLFKNVFSYDSLNIL